MSIRDLLERIYIFRKTYLTRHWHRHFSQFGEDVVLNDWISKDFNNGFYVDVGCYHPSKFSNTCFLHKRGWYGINIDMDAIKIKCFDLARPDDNNINAAVSDKKKTVTVYNFSRYGLGSTIDPQVAADTPMPLLSKTEMETRTLTDIIDASPFKDQRIDLLTIDAEGHDFSVIRSLDMDRYLPKILLTETHFKDIHMILGQPMHQHLESLGYKLFNWVGFTLIYAQPDNGLFKER
jgi:FkbM family methyltransferase